MIKFSIHPSFFFIFLLALVHGFIADVLLLFSIVLIHELGHALAAKYYGWRIKKVELLPFGGVAVVEEHGNRPLKEEIIVICAGPFMNIIMIMAIFSALYLQIGSVEFLYQFLEYNILLLLFNLFPILPLDGGKLLQMFLSLFYPYKQAIKHSLVVSGVCLAGYILLVSYYFPLFFSLWIVALFLCVSQWLEYKQLPYQHLRFLMERYKQGQQGILTNNRLEVVSIFLSAQKRVYEALEHVYRHKEHYYYILSGKRNVTHVISEQEMLEQYFKYHQTTRAVGEIFR